MYNGYRLMRNHQFMLLRLNRSLMYLSLFRSNSCTSVGGAHMGGERECLDACMHVTLRLSFCDNSRARAKSERPIVTYGDYKIYLRLTQGTEATKRPISWLISSHNNATPATPIKTGQRNANSPIPLKLSSVLPVLMHPVFAALPMSTATRRRGKHRSRR